MRLRVFLPACVCAALLIGCTKARETGPAPGTVTPEAKSKKPLQGGNKLPPPPPPPPR
jgi:hypothetical protein